MIFPWRSGNRFELLLDGPQFFPRMFAAIAGAQRQVELELYLVTAGNCATQLVDQLCLAALRGVQVRLATSAPDHGERLCGTESSSRRSVCFSCTQPLTSSTEGRTWGSRRCLRC